MLDKFNVTLNLLYFTFFKMPKFFGKKYHLKIDENTVIDPSDNKDLQALLKIFNHINDFKNVDDGVKWITQTENANKLVFHRENLMKYYVDSISDFSFTIPDDFPSFEGFDYDKIFIDPRCVSGYSSKSRFDRVCENPSKWKDYLKYFIGLILSADLRVCRPMKAVECAGNVEIFLDCVYQFRHMVIQYRKYFNL